jgi:hypothetical protein
MATMRRSETIPPLRGSDLRLKRARRQLGELARQEKRFQEAHRDYFGTVTGPGGQTMFGLTRVDQERMARLSLKAGEILYHLRSALNYAVFDLSRDPTTQKGERWAQFPIEDQPGTWQLRVTGQDARGKEVPKAWWLKGVPHTAVEAIRSMQPQPVGTAEWSKDLQSLSNDDKHMHLMALRTGGSIRETGRELIERDANTDEQATRIWFDAEIENIALADGRPLVDTLYALHVAVVGAVDLLKTCVETSEFPVVFRPIHPESRP